MILIKSFEEEKVQDTNLSLQLLSYVQTNENELLASSDILVNLKTHSDPAKLVLDAIQNPLIRQCTKEDNAVIVDRWQIFLLEQLMRLSPHIKPYVRDEAMKLALDWKANIIPRTAENSMVVLGFLLLLTIYGLVFNEDEVLKIFEVVAHYKHAVELFQTLGFGDKVSGDNAEQSVFKLSMKLK
ncbi:hypothetical protein RIF29_24511 [Crotalaria pallida]|uniref:FRIGIDA-like protein n=1 Tax=Crotalaria pallida TaxID=3830 RepID=A0AAN9EM63_CROPI